MVYVVIERTPTISDNIPLKFEQYVKNDSIPIILGVYKNFQEAYIVFRKPMVCIECKVIEIIEVPYNKMKEFSNEILESRFAINNDINEDSNSDEELDEEELNDEELNNEDLNDEDSNEDYDSY